MQRAHGIERHRRAGTSHGLIDRPDRVKHMPGLSHRECLKHGNDQTSDRRWKFSTIPRTLHHAFPDTHLS